MKTVSVTEDIIRVATKDLNRFWDKVDFTGGPKGCWLWMAHCTDTGYGQFRRDSIKMVRAHRYAWELLVGPIAEGMVLDHLCRVKICVNPQHMEEVTERENILRGYGTPANNARKTHCNKGHAFDGPNTRFYTCNSGYQGRVCRACKRETNQKLRQRRKEDVNN